MPPTSLKLCPDCDGTGTPRGKDRLLNGAVISQLPNVGDLPECSRCKGDGMIWVAEFKQHP